MGKLIIISYLGKRYFARSAAAASASADWLRVKFAPRHI